MEFWRSLYCPWTTAIDPMWTWGQLTELCRFGSGPEHFEMDVMDLLENPIHEYSDTTLFAY
jgi:hypothetical protein